MYVLLAGGLDKPINGMTSMEIDWVRVYQAKIAVAGVMHNGMTS